MPLRTIDDPEGLIAKSTTGPQGLPLVQLSGTDVDRYVLKLKQMSCCEVLGYQLAARLGVPILPVVSVWCPQTFGRRGQVAGDGRIGLAVTYDETFRSVTREQAATTVPEMVAASLVLCLLDRHEWGQFAATEFGLVFYDLERLFPAFCPERMDGQTWDEVAHEVSNAADAYRCVAYSFVPEVSRPHSCPNSED